MKLKKGVDFTGITVVFYCHDGNGEYLFNKRSENCRDEHGRWDCGGGSVEFGDTIQNTIKKELMEEFNANVISTEFLGYRDVHRVNQDGLKTHWIALDFKIHVDRKSVKNNEPQKFDEIGWFDVHNPPQPMHSQWEFAYGTYKDRL